MSASDLERTLDRLDEKVAARLPAAPGSYGTLLLWRTDGSDAEVVLVSLWDDAERVEPLVTPDLVELAGCEVVEPEECYSVLIRGDLALAASLYTNG